MTSGDFYLFRLYVAGTAVNSMQALGNLNALCESSLAGRQAIEVVDVFLDPRRALADGIFMTPALITIETPPVRMIVGNGVAPISRTLFQSEKESDMPTPNPHISPSKACMA